MNTFSSVNAKFYLGGVVYNTNTEWGVFNGTISKVDIYNEVFAADKIADLCYSEDVIVTPEKFENGKIYTFKTSIGWMGARESDNNAISTALASNNATGSDEDTYFQWSVYKSEKGNYYIYNVGKSMFLGEQSTTGNSIVPMSETPAKVTFKSTTKGGYPLMFKTTDNANCVVNHSNQYGSGLITWNGGWSDTKDNGNCHLITKIGDLDNNVLTTIKNAVDAYEADNTEAAEALRNAIDEVKSWVTANAGMGVGKYTYKGAGTFDSKIAEYEQYHANITEKNNPAPAVVEEKTAEVEAIIASFSLNMPETGKFYTFKNDNYYITSSTIETGNKNIAMSTTKDATAIYYYDGSHLLAYTTGLYIGLNDTDWAFEVVGSNDISEIEFVAAANGATAKYNIKSGGRWLHRTDAYVNRCSSNTCGNAHNFTIEEVTSLPVEITDAGYATFFAPVAVTVPTGVTAYWGQLSQAEDALVLTAIEAGSTIPANTGVVLEGNANTYNFNVAENVAVIENNALQGTIAAKTKTENVYTLQQDEETSEIIFAQYTGTNLKGFKAYLVLNNAQAGAISVRFEGTTDIENSEITIQNSEMIYDLLGRRVEAMTKSGIYIVNGRKVVIR